MTTATITSARELTDLIATARHHLLRKHSEPRRLRLLAAGVQADDRQALAAWITDAQHAVEDAEVAAGRGVLHACTVRLTSGADADLPTAGRYGCRIDFIPLSACVSESEDGEPIADEDGQVQWVLRWGNAGVGYMEPAYRFGPADADPADIVAAHRAAMLASGRFFSDRGEALAAVKRMLADRAAAR